MRAIRGPGRIAPGAVGVLALGVLMAGAIALPARALAPDREVRFLEMINDTRAGRGLSKLRSDTELQRVAAAWSRRMAGAGKLSHNPNLGAEYHGAWRKLGENVGRGADVEDIQRAFETSPGHMKNIVDPDFDTVAVAVVEVGDTIYVTEQFRSSGQPPANVPDVLGAAAPATVAPIGATRTPPTVLAASVGSTSIPSTPPTSTSVLAGRTAR